MIAFLGDFAEVAGADGGGDAEGAGENGGVRRRPALVGREAQHPTGRERGGLARGQVGGDDDGFVVEVVEGGALLADEVAHDALVQVPDVVDLGGEGGVAHTGEHAGDDVALLLQGVFGGDVLLFDAFVHRPDERLVAEHALVEGEDCGGFPAEFLLGLVAEAVEFGERGLDGGAQAFEFVGDAVFGDDAARHPDVGIIEAEDPPDGHAGADRYPLELLHQRHAKAASLRTTMRAKPPAKARGSPACDGTM